MIKTCNIKYIILKKKLKKEINFIDFHVKNILL